MKPFNSGAVIAAWLLRALILWFVYQNYFDSFSNFNLKDFNFYISAAYLLFAIFITVGGFMQKEGLTVISGLFLFILPVVQLIRVFPPDITEHLMVYLLPLSTGFLFFTNGNNQ